MDRRIIKIAKKKPVQNDYWYVIVPTDEMTPFWDLQKALEHAENMWFYDDK